jgi:hypothetical protein
LEIRIPFLIGDEEQIGAVVLNEFPQGFSRTGSGFAKEAVELSARLSNGAILGIGGGHSYSPLRLRDEAESGPDFS